MTSFHFVDNALSRFTVTYYARALKNRLRLIPFKRYIKKNNNPISWSREAFRPFLTFLRDNSRKHVSTGPCV